MVLVERCAVPLVVALKRAARVRTRDRLLWVAALHIYSCTPAATAASTQGTWFGLQAFGFTPVLGLPQDHGSGLMYQPPPESPGKVHKSGAAEEGTRPDVMS